MFQSFFDVMISHGRWKLIPAGLGTTLLIAFCAILIGSILGCIFALFKLSEKKSLRAIAEIYTTIIRGIPMATQLMIFYFVVFSPLGMSNALLVAIIAFGINSGAYCTEIFRAGILGVDRGQMEAGRSLGLSWSQTLVKIILPRPLRPCSPLTPVNLSPLSKRLLWPVSSRSWICRKPATISVTRLTMHGFLSFLVPSFIFVSPWG